MHLKSMNMWVISATKIMQLMGFKVRESDYILVKKNKKKTSTFHKV